MTGSDPPDINRTRRFVDFDTLVRDRLPRVLAISGVMWGVLAVGFATIYEYGVPAWAAFLAGIMAEAIIIHPIAERFKSW